MHSPALTASSAPSSLEKGLGYTAHVWQNVQNRIARIFGAKDANNLSNTLMGVGVGTLVAGNILFPGVATAVTSIGTFITGLGISSKVETIFTGKIAKNGGYGSRDATFRA